MEHCIRWPRENQHDLVAERVESCFRHNYLIGSQLICRYDKGQADVGNGAVIKTSGSSLNMQFYVYIVGRGVK